MVIAIACPGGNEVILSAKVQDSHQYKQTRNGKIFHFIESISWLLKAFSYLRKKIYSIIMILYVFRVT